MWPSSFSSGCHSHLYPILLCCFWKSWSLWPYFMPSVTNTIDQVAENNLYLLSQSSGCWSSENESIGESSPPNGRESPFAVFSSCEQGWSCCVLQLWGGPFYESFNCRENASVSLPASSGPENPDLASASLQVFVLSVPAHLPQLCLSPSSDKHSWECLTST